jgi:valyl-tRNA synthetase
MMPFVTEELYQRLPLSATKAESIVVADYPQAVVGWTNARVEDQMELIKSVIGGFRSHMAQLGVKNNARPRAFVCMPASEDDHKLLSRNAHLVANLAKLESLEVIAQSEVAALPNTVVVSVVSDRCSVYIDAAGMVDFKVEVDKLIKKRTLVEKSLQGIEKKKAMAGYLDKVPAEVRAENDEKETAYRVQLKEIDAAVEMLRAAGGL